MKKTRITAFFLVLAMLLSMLPASVTADHVHNWIERTRKDPTCTKKGSVTYYCFCGEIKTETVPAKGHKWGSWKVTKKATCSHKGTREHTCSVCGAKESEDIKKTPHKWGEWEIITEATDHSTGRMAHVCQVCGERKEEDYYPEGTLLPGDKGEGVKNLQKRLNDAGYGVGKPDGTFGQKTVQAVKAIEKAHGVEADGIAWPGVQKWLNGGDYAWQPPNENVPDGQTNEPGETEEPEEPEKPEEPEEPEEPAEPAETGEPEKPEGETAPAAKGPDTVPALDLALISFSPGYTFGDEASFVVNVINCGGVTLYGCEIDRYRWDGTGGFVKDETIFSSPGYFLNPAEDLTMPDFFDITEKYAPDPGWLHVAYDARSWTADGEMVETGLVSMALPLSFVSVILEAEESPAPQTPDEGWVKAKLKVSNVGTETVSQFDSLCWSNIIGLPSSDKEMYSYPFCEGLVWFNPGNSEEVELRIKLVENDVKAGEVCRSAQMEFLCLVNEDGSSVTSTAPDGKGAPGPGVYPTNTVEVVIPLAKSAPEPDTEPDPDPDTEPETEPEPEPQPAAPPAPQPQEYCVSDLIGTGTGVARWKLIRCPEHAKVAEAADRLVSGAEGKDERAAAWGGAVKLWSDALEAEYKEMTAKAKKNKKLKAAVEKEKKYFDEQLLAYGAALTLDYPDNSDLVSRKVAETLARRTVTLCYENHTAPDARADLLSASDGELFAAPVKGACGRRTDEAAETSYVTDTICTAHQEIEAMAAEAGDAGAWRQVRQAWQDALDEITDRRYLAADEAGKAIISEERLSFGRWLEAREALLALRYPDQDAVVQELMSQAIRERVIDLCGGYAPRPAEE